MVRTKGEKMKIRCSGTELSDAVSKVSRALPVKKNNPILEGIKLVAKGDTLTLFATDLELSIEKKINAEVLLEGEIVVPGKLFAEYTKKIEEEEIELDGTIDGKLKICYLDSEVSLNCYEAEEFPILKEVSNDNSFIIQKKKFKELINSISFSVAVEDARPSLKGCCFNIDGNILEGVASDGYRLALCKVPIENKGITEKIVIPVRSLNEASRLLDDEDEAMTVYVEKNYMLIDLFHTKIVTRMITEEYINYERIIPLEFSTEIKVEKKHFENAIDRVFVISKNEKKCYVRMEIKEDNVYLKAESTVGEVNEKLPISMKGKDILIAFNAKYIADSMKSITDQFISFNFTTNTAPGIIKGENDNWLYLILPLRVIG